MRNKIKMAARREEKDSEMKFPQVSQPVLMTEGSFTEASPSQAIDGNEIGLNGEMLNEKIERLSVLDPESYSPSQQDELKYVPPVQDPYTRSVKYMEEHNIMQIFQHLTAEIVYHKPTDPLQHMLEELNRMVEERNLKRKETLKDAEVV